MDKTRLAGRNNTRLSNKPQPEQRNGWLSVAEVAEVLRVDPRTIRGMVFRGEIDGMRAGRVLRIPPDAIENLSRRREAR